MKFSKQWEMILPCLRSGTGSNILSFNKMSKINVFRKDNNKVPPESILLPITTHLPHFLNKRMPKLQARDSGIWWGTLGKLQLMLRKASQALYVNEQFTLEEMHNYR